MRGIARRILIAVALAAIAVVPLRAFGVGAGSPGGLAVGASLGGCGIAGAAIVCTIEASWSGVEGAEYYTASVTGPDGSVQGFGTVGNGAGGGSARLPVNYVGAGDYTVTVSAYGSEGEPGDDPKLLDEESAEADGGSGSNDDKEAKSGSSEGDDGSSGAQADEAEGGSSDAPASADGTEPAEQDPTPSAEDSAEPATEPAAAPAPSEPATQTLPQCRPPEATSADGTDGDTAQTAATAPSVQCTDPSLDAGGPCCPPGA